jgi:hypothetical protein
VRLSGDFLAARSLVLIPHEAKDGPRAFSPKSGL